MTNELAIRILTGDVLGTSEQTQEAVTMAVKALSQSYVPDTNVGDKISRQAAIDALWKALFKYEDDAEKQFQESDELDVSEWILHRIFVQNMSDIDRQTILNLPSTQPDCSDCIKHGGDWDCDHVHCHKGEAAQPDNDMIHLQKEQAYLQGWEEGRKALRKEIWEDGRDRLD